ncbi:MAG: hypothetical protein LBC19_09955 [Tannerella sp.]|nr:hypothetical protein [Tannerella sp.]
MKRYCGLDVQNYMENPNFPSACEMEKVFLQRKRPPLAGCPKESPPCGKFGNGEPSGSKAPLRYFPPNAVSVGQRPYCF